MPTDTAGRGPMYVLQHDVFACRVAEYVFQPAIPDPTRLRALKFMCEGILGGCTRAES